MFSPMSKEHMIRVSLRIISISRMFRRACEQAWPLDFPFQVLMARTKAVKIGGSASFIANRHSFRFDAQTARAYGAVGIDVITYLSPSAV